MDYKTAPLFTLDTTRLVEKVDGYYMVPVIRENRRHRLQVNTPSDLQHWFNEEDAKIVISQIK